MTSIIDHLNKFSNCDLGHAHGGFLEGIHLYSPEYLTGDTKIVGPTFTVKFEPKSNTPAPNMKGNYVDEIPKDAFVFISQLAPHIGACYGDLASLRAKHLGAAGVIIDGSVRDLQEHRDLGLPLSARTHGTTAGGAVCFPS
ncbi:hypothetical protein ACHAPJ_009046 [Fusarium lateritium]